MAGGANEVVGILDEYRKAPTPYDEEASKVLTKLKDEAVNFHSRPGDAFGKLPFPIGDVNNSMNMLPMPRFANIPHMEVQEWPELMKASYSGNIEQVNQLVQRNNVDEKTSIDQFTALMAAAFNGHLEVVRTLIKKGANLNMTNYMGQSALLLACQNEHYELVKLLLVNGAKSNAQDNIGVSALMISCAFGRYEMAKLLLEHGANPNLQDRSGNFSLIVVTRIPNDQQNVIAIAKLLLKNSVDVNMQNFSGQTALHAATSAGQYCMIELLLASGAKIDIQDNRGFSPLMIASFRGYIEAINIFLKKGAQCELADYGAGFSALMYGCYCGIYEIVKLLLQYNKGTLNFQSNTGSTALMLACTLGHCKIVKLLLKYEVGLNIQDTILQRTALIEASIGNFLDIVKLLLASKALPDVQDVNGSTALMEASINGSTDVVKILIENGAKPNVQDKFGNTALLKASSRGHYKVVKFLLAHNADPDILSSDDVTPLMAASFFGHVKIVQRLIDRVQLNRKNSEGMTALMLACKQGHYEISLRLIEKGADVNLTNKSMMSALLFAVLQGNYDLVELLLNNNADVNSQDARGASALMIASSYGGYTLVELLLNNGAKIDSQDKVGRSALIYACLNAKYSVAKLLIKNGSSVDMQTSNGVTSLMFSSYRSFCELVEILLAGGANLNLKDNKGYSALMVAGSRDVAEVLLENGAIIDETNTKGDTALNIAIKSRFFDIASLLIDHGANTTIPDINGNFPLHSAVLTGKIEFASLLVSKGTKSVLYTANKNAETVLMLASTTGNYDIAKFLLDCSEVDRTDLWRSLRTAIEHRCSSIILLLFKECIKIIQQNVDYPGIQFFGYPYATVITQKQITIEPVNSGVSLFVPEQALEGSARINLLINFCSSGPFKLPTGYKSASPVYLIQPERKVKFKKDVTVRINHYYSLLSDEDCNRMVFLSASVTPQYRKGKPVYVFKKMAVSTGNFECNSKIGEIRLRHFCLLSIAYNYLSPVIPTISYLSPSKQFYSARLYRNITGSALSGLSAVFCMSLLQPQYIKLCDERITKGYTNMSCKEEAKSEQMACIIADEVTLAVVDSDGWIVKFDKEPTKILKSNIDLPELLGPTLVDYPPRFSIFIRRKSEKCNSQFPKLLVKGLSVQDCMFELITPYDSINPPSTPPHIQNDEYEGIFPLNIFNVLTELSEVVEEWRFLGLALHIPHCKIREIEANNRNDVKKCLEIVIQTWLYMDNVEQSWTALCKALRSKLVDCDSIAQQIEDKLSSLKLI